MNPTKRIQLKENKNKRIPQLFKLILVNKQNQFKSTSFTGKLNAIIKHYHSEETFNVNMLCEKLCLCPMQVYRKVKNLTGLSPGKYILLYRLKIALSMLQDTEYTIGEIAFQIGFSNQNNFSRAFKRELGSSPRHLRTFLNKE